MLNFCLGNRKIPDSTQPFVFDDPSKIPPWMPAQRRVLQSVDAFIFEVSELRHVRYRDSYFQIQVFMRNFVSKYGATLLPWYREFSVGRPVSDEIVHQALSRLPKLPSDQLKLTESILREARLEEIDVEAAKQFIRSLVATARGHWTFVSHFLVPNLGGTLMQDRAKLREILADATAECGVQFFDPSDIVARHGRTEALANQGKDIYHYNPAFQAEIGEALLRKLHCTAEASSERLGGNVKAFTPLDSVSAALNALLTVVHRERLDRFGVDESGLHAHYALLLERRQVLGAREVIVADLVLRFLPEHEAYHVLRAGLGEVAFLLAAFGRKTSVFDPFQQRIAALTAGADYLKDCGFPIAEGFEIHQATVPDVAPGNRTLAVATQLLITASPKEEEEILQRLEAYEAIVFNPMSLVRVREEPGETGNLLDRFMRAGFSIVRDYPFANVVYCAKERSSDASVKPSAITHSTSAGS
jgi:hypothetical protein